MELIACSTRPPINLFKWLGCPQPFTNWLVRMRFRKRLSKTLIPADYSWHLIVGYLEKKTKAMTGAQKSNTCTWYINSPDLWDVMVSWCLSIVKWDWRMMMDQTWIPTQAPWISGQLSYLAPAFEWIELVWLSHSSHLNYWYSNLSDCLNEKNVQVDKINE